MSTNGEDIDLDGDDVRVIPVKGEETAGHDVDDSPKLSLNRELEDALKAAVASIESEEKKYPKKTHIKGAELEKDERDFYQNKVRELHVQLLEKTKEIEKLNEQSIRRQADFENYKKRLQKENADRYNYGNEQIAKAFLEVLDNLDRALKHAGDANSAHIIEGVKLTQRRMESIFEQFDVKPVKAMGEKFDPNFHEAIAQMYRENVEPGIVIEEQQRGYMLKDRLLRPTLVIVSGKKPEAKNN